MSLLFEFLGVLFKNFLKVYFEVREERKNAIEAVTDNRLDADEFLSRKRLHIQNARTPSVRSSRRSD